MQISKIKPIPKYIKKIIYNLDIKTQNQDGHTRYYAYLTKNAGELVKVTVAVKTYKKKWYCRQCAVHGIHSKLCFVKDMNFFFVGGYITGWYYEGASAHKSYYECNEWGWIDDKYYDVYAPVINLDYLKKFPEYKYSAIELLQGTKVLQYLRLYEEFPQLEYLMKAGLTKFYDSRQILKKIGTDIAFCKWLINNKEILSSDSYYIDVILRAYRTGRNIDELQSLKKAKLDFSHDDSYNNLKELFKGKDLERLLLYISKQKTSLSSYKDYYHACVNLELDMSEDKNRYPHDFKRWHDIRIDQNNTKKAELDALKRKELYAQFASIADKYLALEKQNGREYIAIIAHSPAELIREGDILHHCVGRMNYDQRFVREESLIFFIRLKADVNTPLVTVEYSLKSHRVLQCYGENDHKPEESILHFVNKIWLPHANRQLKLLAA